MPRPQWKRYQNVVDLQGARKTATGIISRVADAKGETYREYSQWMLPIGRTWDIFSVAGFLLVVE